MVVGDRVVFFDPQRHALRSAGADGVVTLAGSIEGLRDGAAPEAQLFEVGAIAALPDGRIAVLDQDRAKRTVVLRMVQSAPR
ncbi:MAG: hypothetical protein IT370_24770 [Deltaproteobacteria bacterium]|nr:hypothetical protein [Deltaproteobacteria bacterium]